jgi:uncharacterized membrane protein
MNIRTANRIGAAATALAFGAAGALYSRLPERVPTHWNWRGEIDGWTAKPLGPFVMPLAMAGVLALMAAVPRLSPKRWGVEPFESVYALLQTVMTAFFAVMTGALLLAGLGRAPAMSRVVDVAAGLVLAVVGNFLGKVTKNFFVGIRTPWTLASDEVWLRTHRLGGKLLVATGALAVISGLAGWSALPFLVALGLTGAVTTVYSYVVYRRVEG